MKITANSPEEYLDQLSEERKDALSIVRETILKNIHEGFVEDMNYNMISFVIPLSEYPSTYNKKPLTLASLGSQKNYMALYLNNIYSDNELKNWFVTEYKKTGKRLDMGKSCVRFRKLDDLPLELIAEVISITSVQDFIKYYEKAKNL